MLGRLGPQDDHQKSADTSRTQLNVAISTELLKEAKIHARKAGLTLTEFVTTLLTEAVATEKSETLSDRLHEIEVKLQRLVAYQVSSNTAKSIKGKIWKFSDKGAQEYSEVAIQEFERYALIYKLSSEQALEQIKELAYNYGSEEAEIIINILSRKVVANATIWDALLMRLEAAQFHESFKSGVVIPYMYLAMPL